MQHLIVAPILLPLAVSGLLLAFDERRRALKRLVSLATVAALAGIAVMLLWLVTDGFGLGAASAPRAYLPGNWTAPFWYVLVAVSQSVLLLLLPSGLCITPPL